METQRASPVIPHALGTLTRWGKIGAVGWVGERYYWMVAPDGGVAMMPAATVEENAAMTEKP